MIEQWRSIYPFLVLNSLTEPSHRVDELHSALLKNSSSQLLVNDSYDVGVWSAPKVEQAYILDMDSVEKLAQKSVGAIDLVAHQLFDQMCLRGRRENQQKIVKSQEQKLAVPEPALIKDLDSSRKEPAILMTIVITEKDTKKFELGFSRWW
uniref:Uncharacterized protein n=1 Tax=Brassica campestris TaxID=3711 RepID=M4DCP5_BRACM